MSSRRIDYLDSCKAIGILLVILGHTYHIPDWLYSFIYSFHMPLFFMLSGMVFNPRKSEMSFSAFFVERFKKYILPYLGFAFANLVLQIVYTLVFYRKLLGLDYILHNTKGILLCYANMEHMPNCTPLWFLMCLFWSNIIFWLIIKYCKKATPFVLALCAVVSHILNNFDDYQFPWKLPTALMAVLFMYIGFQLVQKDLVGKINYLGVGGFVLIALLSFALNKHAVAMNWYKYVNLIFYLVPAITLSVALICMCSKLSVLKTSFFPWLGKNTVFIIAFSYFLRDLTTEIYYMIPVIKTIPISSLVSFVFTTAACLVGIVCWNKLKTIPARVIGKSRF